MAERDEAQAREDFRLGRGEAFAIDRGDVLAHRRDKVPPRTLKRLSQGLYAAQDELDLHYADAAGAEALLRRFLAEAHDAGFGWVRVIHGKGRRSGNRGPVLKLVASHYLARIDAVLAFASAREVDGGSGALLVLLHAPLRAAARKRHAPTQPANSNPPGSSDAPDNTEAPAQTPGLL